jgi:serine/threonine-protein kinase RsbT
MRPSHAWSTSGVTEEARLAAEQAIPIRSSEDVVAVRAAGRTMAEQLGFSGTDLMAITLAISEVARNIIQYAQEGEVILRTVRQGDRRGIEVLARDDGPGIADIDLAMQDGYSTSGGLGLGLPGARRLMDEFSIDSEVDRGTQIKMKKWRLSRQS